MVSDARLARRRTQVEARHFPDTMEAFQPPVPSESNYGQGGTGVFPTDWGNAGTGIPCRIGTLIGRAKEGGVAMQTKSTERFTIFIPTSYTAPPSSYRLRVTQRSGLVRVSEVVGDRQVSDAYSIPIECIEVG